MSFGITDPITGELAENKANRGGDNLTNPATWRTALDVPAVADGYTKAESNTRLNALAPRQAIQLPAGINATGVSGLNFGTGDFSIALPSFRLADYTISDTDAANLIFQSHNTGNNRVRVGVRLTGGVWRIAFTDDSGVDTTYAITPTVALVDNTVYSVTLVFNRSGDAVFYVNGVANGSVSIAAAAAIDIGNGNTNGYRLNGGTASVMMLAAAIAFNFALPATTTSGVVGVAERYADGVWVRPSEQQAGAGIVTGNFVNSTQADRQFASISGESTTGVTATYNNANSTNRIGIPIRGYSKPITLRVRFNAALNGGAGVGIQASVASTFGSGGGFYIAVSEGANDILISSVPTSIPIVFIFFNVLTIPASGDLVISDFSVQEYSATLDLQPQGIGRTIIDRSANRNHATVGGTTLPTYLQPTDGGKIIARTALGSFAQLQGAPAFDAANRYRIRNWVVTAAANCTISLSNANSGAVYVSGLALTAGVPTDVSLLTRIATTADLWCTCNVADPVTHVIEYERISN